MDGLGTWDLGLGSNLGLRRSRGRETGRRFDAILYTTFMCRTNRLSVRGWDENDVNRLLPFAPSYKQKGTHMCYKRKPVLAGHSPPIEGTSPTSHVPRKEEIWGTLNFAFPENFPPHRLPDSDAPEFLRQRRSEKSICDIWGY